MAGGPLVTVKPVNGADGPAGVNTEKGRVPAGALASIVTVMGRLAAVPPVPIVAVTPVPLKPTAVAPFRFAPLMVAGRLLPAAPEDGVIPVITGPAVTVKPVNGAD